MPQASGQGAACSALPVKYVTWVHERFGRIHQGIGEAYVTPFELNLGRKPRLEGHVAFGTPGYAFVPPEVRHQT